LNKDNYRILFSIIEIIEIRDLIKKRIIMRIEYQEKEIIIIRNHENRIIVIK